MSRKFTKRMKRERTTQLELLERLVKAHDEWAKAREEAFLEIPSYDPVDGDQPCADKDMGDYDEYEEIYASNAQDEFIGFATEARKVLEGV
ncbi:hypothetical protein ACFRJ3_34980 [Streptomyces sp. NPDC056696]|uniref:hypothetical protein n=1 Tax=unclassified Streptomyces TaxID=2593676 RepID=UPI00365ECDB3